MKKQYARYVKFLRDTIVDAGCTKTSGQPNVDEFYKKFSYALQGTGLKLSKTSFGNQAKGVENSPFGHTLEAMAVILSAARKEKVTVAMLDSLIDRKPLNDFESLAAAPLPDDKTAAGVRAEQLLKEIRSLPIDARATIAPQILKMLALDLQYLSGSEYVKVSLLLQFELARRGGCEAFAKVMSNIIPADILEDIRDCRMLRNPLTHEQILVLQEHMKSIDGDRIGFKELECLSQLHPNLKSPRLRGQ